MTALRGYAALIAEAIGVQDRPTIAKVEDTMRHIVFHSTLDWIDRPTFIKGAREAYGIVRLMARGASPILTPEDETTARLLGVQPDEVPGLAKEACQC